MRQVAWLAFCALVACARHDAEAEYPREERHPCDPKGADVARYEDPPIDDELFPDELALRGKCDEQPMTRDMTRRVHETVDAVEAHARGHRSCSGVCEPFRAALPQLDDKHDLEDETFQSECTAAVAKLDANVRGGCRHVCLVERRLEGSRMLFARVMRGLDAFESKLPNVALGDAEVRRMWSDEKLPPPPKRVRLATTIGADTAMTAEGTLYPSGPALRLRLARGDAGCGATEWTVDRW